MSEQRDADSQFVKACAPSPGRPRRQTERSYLLGLSEAVTPEAWGQIVQRAIADATGGDARARSWISNHLLPKPGTGVLQSQADHEARQDRFDRGELTTDDIIAMLAGSRAPLRTTRALPSARPSRVGMGPHTMRRTPSAGR
jgi:hypothetical protein